MIMFADIHISAIYADKIILQDKIASFMLKDSVACRIYLTRHHEIKRYNFDENNNLKSISCFVLNDDKIVEKIEEAS